MDKDRRTKCQEGDAIRRTPQEINCNSTYVEKRKKMRSKNHCRYLQEWLDKSCSFEEGSEGVYASESERNFLNNPSCWPSHTTMPRNHPGQRLYSSVSNPTVCHYSVPSLPLGYAIEPGSLPVYAMYPPPVQPTSTWRPMQGLHQPPSLRGRPHRLSKNISTLPSHRSSWNSSHHGLKHVRAAAMISDTLPQPMDPSQEFASLPPQMQTHESTASQRRFSDPGLGPSPVGNEASDLGAESSDSESLLCSSSSNTGIVLELVEQVNALRNSNKQLSRQLHYTRNELHTLKLQAAAWKPPQPEYQPGLLSDLVREVRDAAQVREEALLARVRHIVGDGHWTTSSPTPGHSQTDHLKAGLAQTALPTDAVLQSNVDERLGRIEVCLQNLQLQANHKDYHVNPANHKSRTIVRGDLPVHPLPDQLADLEDEKVQLRCKLQAELNGRKAAEVHAQKLERLVSILRKKINGPNADEQALTSLDQCPSSLENTSESLASICSSSAGSTHSPHVTMSGPVTDL